MYSIITLVSVISFGKEPQKRICMLLVFIVLITSPRDPPKRRPYCLFIRLFLYLRNPDNCWMEENVDCLGYSVKGMYQRMLATGSAGGSEPLSVISACDSPEVSQARQGLMAAVGHYIPRQPPAILFEQFPSAELKFFTHTSRSYREQSIVICITMDEYKFRLQ